MFLKKLSVLNYKNIESVDFEFSPKMNCFVGNNGSGKTNLIDAIYHLGMTKSYFNPLVDQNIRYGQDFYMLDGTFVRKQKQESVVCSVRKGQRKQIKRNGKLYEKITSHIGEFPIVIVSPSDKDLITDSSETRRKFIDGVISLINQNYLISLMNYNRVLVQRNSLLKHFFEQRFFDEQTLQIYDQQLCNYAQEIYKERVIFLQNFIPLFEQQYQIISGNKEKVSIIYKTQLAEQSFSEILMATRERDRAMQYTTQGVHKDDLIFELEDYPIKRNGSQGQQKTFLIALRLAQYRFLYQKNGVKPILLLDDIFDKLDAFRVSQILQLVSFESFGQIFLSDTHSERTKQIVQEIFDDYQVFSINRNKK